MGDRGRLEGNSRDGGIGGKVQRHGQGTTMKGKRM